MAKSIHFYYEKKLHVVYQIILENIFSFIDWTKEGLNLINVKTLHIWSLQKKIHPRPNLEIQRYWG